MNIDIEKIKKKHKVIITKAVKLTKEIKDKGHSYEHLTDVIDNMIDIIEGIPDGTKIDIDVCTIAAYWHDVGRTITEEGYEKYSAELLTQELQKEGYDKKFIKACSDAIIHHRWNMMPTTLEGHVVKDADKISLIGVERWKNCINHNHRIDSTLKLLTVLRNDLLYFDISKKIYDEKVVDLIQALYDYIFLEK